MGLMSRRRMLMATINDSRIVQALRELNLIKNQTYYPGYVNEYGRINQPSSTNREVYSDLFDNPFHDSKFLSLLKFPRTESPSPWYAIVYYDNNGVFRSRQILGSSIVTSFDGASYCAFINNASYTDGKCRITFRSFDGAELFICNYPPLFEVLEQSAATENYISN